MSLDQIALDTVLTERNFYKAENERLRYDLIQALRLNAEIERLRAALRPFAASFQIGSGYSRDDFQRASEAYGEITIQQSKAPEAK